MNSIKWSNSAFAPSQFNCGYQRLALPLLLIILLFNEHTRSLSLGALSDAFWAVSTYVALTLTCYHYLSRYMSSAHWLVLAYQQSRHIQVIIASLLGALPGCGGAIVVTTQFVSGRVGFGALVAVLTSTMGDAAFLLLASKPLTGLGVISIGIITGCLTGFVINYFHDDAFLRPQKSQLQLSPSTNSPSQHVQSTALNLQGLFWKLLLIPTSFVALAGSFQIDLNVFFNLKAQTMQWIGAILAIISMLLWSLTTELDSYQTTVSEDKKVQSAHPIQKAAQDTHFVSAWVIIAFLSFELIRHFSGWEPIKDLAEWAEWMPLLGVVVGLLPGCGPQILITSLYLSGVVPFSTQISNAISNDGDALFPAIALAPKAAILATVYTSIPALIVGYGCYWWFEM